MPAGLHEEVVTNLTLDLPVLRNHRCRWCLLRTDRTTRLLRATVYIVVCLSLAICAGGCGGERSAPSSSVPELPTGGDAMPVGGETTGSESSPVLDRSSEESPSARASKPSTGGSSPSARVSRRPGGSSSLSARASKLSAGDGSAPAGARKSSAGDSNAWGGDSGPPTGDGSAPAGDSNALAGDNKPLAGDNKPLAGDNNAPAGDDKPSAGDDKPSAGDDKPSAGDDKPSAGDDKPSAGVPVVQPPPGLDEPAGDCPPKCL
jgi:hypothetical protein